MKRLTQIEAYKRDSADNATICHFDPFRDDI